MEHASGNSTPMTRPNADRDELTCAADDNSDEEFWMNLPACDSRASHIQSIPTQASHNYPGMIVKSRADALRATKFHVKDVVEIGR